MGPTNLALKMKSIVSLVILLMAPLVQAEDMQKYLSDTEDLARAGKHEEALKRHIWFHDHALEHERAMYGVRLSFALGNWRKLGEKYPPAMKALVEIRDKKTKLLLGGKKSHELFHDVSSINQTLGESEKTVSLFEQIDEKQPKNAKGYWNVAKDEVIDAKKYDLARKYIGKPANEFIRLKARYDENTSFYDDPRIGGDRFKAYNENMLVVESLRLIKVSIAIGDQKAALEIQKKALAVVDDRRLRDAIPVTDDQKDKLDQ